MTQSALAEYRQKHSRWLAGVQGVVADWSSDQRAFKKVPWGKAMMWIFLLSDTFIFSSFLISYMTVRMSTQAPWPNPSEVFALTIARPEHPAHPDRHHDVRADQQQRDDGAGGQLRLPQGSQVKTFIFLLLTAALGATFVGHAGVRVDQADLGGGVRPWGNPMGAAQFGSSFFMITGFHGTHVSIGVIFLIIVAIKVLRGDLDTREARVPDRQERQLRDGRDDGSVLALRRSRLGIHLRSSSISGKKRPWHTQKGITTPAAGHAHAAAGEHHVEGQQHPLGIYFKIWGLLFVLSTAVVCWSTTSTSRVTCGGR